MHIIDRVFEVEKPYVGGIGHGFRRATLLGNSGLVPGKRISVDECMSRSSPFDLP
jgi:hypothetical protein